MAPSVAPATSRRARHLYAAGIAAFTLLASTLWLHGDGAVLRWLGVEPMTERFADARTITAAGTALERGLDPLVVNPDDPWGRPLNYPRIWLLLAEAGLRPEHTRWLAAAFAGAFVAALWHLGALVHSRRQLTWLLLAVFAPTSWFALERANSDLLLLALATATATLAASRPALALCVAAAAAALKLYPIATLFGCFGPDRRTTLRRWFVGGACFLAYLWWLGDDLQRIRDATTHAHWLSYGYSNLPTWLGKNTPLSVPQLLLLARMALIAMAVWAYRLRCHHRIHVPAESGWTLTAFRVGAAVYLLSFAVGDNFDYRLVFLILTVPQLCAWTHEPRQRARRTAGLVLATTLTMLWSPTWRATLTKWTGDATMGIAIDEWCSWLLWLGLCCLAALSLPDWFVPDGWRRDRATEETGRGERI